MKDLQMRSLVMAFTILIALIFFLRSPLELFFDRTDPLDYSHYLVEIVDDTGYRIKMKTYPERIVSLHPAHTINLFKLGLDQQIMGVHDKDIWPLEAVDKRHFNYSDDPGDLLREKPDLILITPEIKRENPDFVNQLRRSGVNVFAIYPVNMNDVERYFKTLGRLTGKKKTAELYYESFEKKLAELNDSKQVVSKSPQLYYEISEMKGLIASKASIQDTIIELSGGELWHTANADVYEMTSPLDLNKVPDIGQDIDIILTEQGGPDKGGSEHSVVIRQGYDTLKSVQNQMVHEIDFRIMGLPTIEFANGVEEMRRILHPDVYGQIEESVKDQELNKATFSKWLVYKGQMFTFYPSLKYFEDAERGHYYGHFEDVLPMDENFKYIETAVQAGYLKGRYDDEGLEWFEPEKSVTKDEFAFGLYLAYDINALGNNVIINDIESSIHPRIVEKLVGLGVLSLDDQLMFNPTDTISEKDAFETILRIEALVK